MSSTPQSDSGLWSFASGTSDAFCSAGTSRAKYSKDYRSRSPGGALHPEQPETHLRFSSPGRRREMVRTLFVRAKGAVVLMEGAACRGASLVP